MSTYTDPPKDATDLLNDVLHSYEEHAPLVAAGVTIALQWCHGKQRKDGTVGDAIKHHGVKALGVAKIRNIEDRTEGMSDGKIKIDADWWETSSPEEHRALLDHECYHFDLKLDEAGVPETDDCMRPKLIMRKHDHDFGWFNLIAARHGTHSQERIQFKHMCETSGQYLLPEMFRGNFMLPHEVAHGGDTLTVESDGKVITMPAEDAVRVHAGAERQISDAN